MGWLRGKKQIMAALNVNDWRTVKKLIARGAPITKIDGMWLTVEPLCDAWLGEKLVEASQRATEARKCLEDAS